MVRRLGWLLLLLLGAAPAAAQVTPAGGIQMQEDGVMVGMCQSLNFTGSGVDTSVSGGVCTINIPGGAAGSGTVTHITGPLTINQLVIGNANDDVKPLGSAGTSTQVLHGGAPPTWSQVNLAADVTGDLPYANFTPATAASKLLGRGDSGAGDWQELTLGTNLSMSGTTLNATGGAGGTPGGADTQVQFNDAGAFGGDAGLTYNKTTDTLSLGRLLTQDGSAATPAQSFTSASNTGWYREPTGELGVSFAGVTRAFMSASGAVFAGNGTDGAVLGLQGSASNVAALLRLGTGASAPGTPGANDGVLYFDRTAKTLFAKGDAGVVSHTVQTKAAVSNNFLTAIADDGAVTAAQPAFSNLSGSVAAGQMPALTGDVTSTAGTVATTIPNNTVTYAKMQDVSGASLLLGRGSAGGAGDPQEITLGAGLTMTGTTLSSTGGSGAPVTATYWTSTPDITLLNETNMGALTTGLVLNTVSGGIGTPSAYAGTTPCSAGNFISALNASGVATCGTPSGSGNVSAAGTLANNQIVLGQGTTAVATLGTLGSTNTVLHGGAGAPTFSAVDLTADVTGDLPFASLAQGSALSVLGVTGNATADHASIVAGADGNVLRRSGTAVGFGAVNLSSSNAVTNRLPYANLPSATGGSKLVGRGSSGVGDLEEITLGTNLSMSGTTLNATGGGTTPTGTGFTHITAGAQDAAAKLVDTADINNSQVTYGKIQDVSAASKLLGRGDSGSGAPQEITLGSGLTMTGTTLAAAGGSTDTVVVTTADVTVVESTTLVNVTGLLLGISSSATEQWEFTCTLLSNADNAGSDFKFGFTVPTSATMLWSSLGDQGVGTAQTPQVGTQATTLSFGGLNGTVLISLRGTIFGGGTSGNVQLQFALNSIAPAGSQTNKMLKGSWCRYAKLVS